MPRVPADSNERPWPRGGGAMAKEIAYRLRKLSSYWIWEVLLDGVTVASGVERGSITARGKALAAAAELSQSTAPGSPQPKQVPESDEW
jgi:hypothetical protein